MDDGVHLGRHFGLSENNRIRFFWFQLIECAILVTVFLVDFQDREGVFICLCLGNHLSHAFFVFDRSQIDIKCLLLFIRSCLESGLYFFECISSLIVQFEIGREIICVCSQNIC